VVSKELDAGSKPLIQRAISLPFSLSKQFLIPKKSKAVEHLASRSE